MRPASSGDGEAGMVTAEFATVLPALVLVLALVLGCVRIGIDQVRCVDAARVGARAAARGDAPEDIVSAARRAAPEGAAVTVGRVGHDVSVIVQAAPVARLPLVGSLPAPSAEARALDEAAS